MKTRLLLILLVAFYITSCNEEDSIQQGKVQFSFFAVGVDNTGGRTQAFTIPAGSSLRITVKRDNGDNVFTSKKIELVKVGDGFVTDPVNLPQGRYNIEDFMIVNQHDSLLFAVPKRGSLLAQWVKNPLAISFNVGKDAVSSIEGEVVSAESKTSQDFGYASFGVKIASTPGFSVAAFTSDHEKVKLATANAFILQGQDTVLKTSLSASVNNINWNATSGTVYTLVITKDGYAKYQQAFSLDTLTSGPGSKPLSIVLQPALTVTWTLASSTIFLDGDAGANLQIDWGDNTLEKTTLQNLGFSHTYTTTGKYFVSITGDLDAINFFEIEYQDGINYVSPVHLSALEDFRLPLCEYTSNSIDFSGNTKLQNIDLSGIRGHLLDIDISNNTALIDLDLQGDSLTTAIMDKLIDDLYASCVNNNKRNGYLNVHTVLFDNPYNPSSRDIIGPPSSPQVAKLQKLADDFGWFVFPISTMSTPAKAGRAPDNVYASARLNTRLALFAASKDHGHTQRW